MCPCLWGEEESHSAGRWPIYETEEHVGEAPLINGEGAESLEVCIALYSLLRFYRNTKRESTANSEWWRTAIKSFYLGILYIDRYMHSTCRASIALLRNAPAEAWCIWTMYCYVVVYLQETGHCVLRTVQVSRGEQLLMQGLLSEIVVNLKRMLLNERTVDRNSPVPFPL